MNEYLVRGSKVLCPICKNKLFKDISDYLPHTQNTLICGYCSYHLNFGLDFHVLKRKEV